MKRAEAKCNRQKNTSYEWSPTLAKMGSRVSYWKLRKTLANTAQDMTEIRHRQKVLGIKDTCTSNLSYINAQLRMAWGELHQAQRTSGQLRRTHLEDLAAHKAEAGGSTAAAEIKKLLHIEQVRKTAKKHGWYLKEKRKGMIDHILLPTPNVTEATTLIFFLLAPAWIQITGWVTGGTHSVLPR